MKKENLFTITIPPVKKVISFERKQKGTHGQQIVCDIPDGDYTYRYECCDKEDYDFSILEKGQGYSVICEPYLRVENIKRFDGNNMYVSIPSYRIISVNKE